MIIQEAVEGAVHSVVDVVHDGRLIVLMYSPLGDDVSGEGIGAGSEVPARLGYYIYPTALREMLIQCWVQLSRYLKWPKVSQSTGTGINISCYM